MAAEDSTEKGRYKEMIELPIEPPEPRYECEVECPNCGMELHEGDRVYQMMKKHKNWLPTLEIFACEYCINDFMTWVEDL